MTTPPPEDPAATPAAPSGDTTATPYDAVPPAAPNPGSAAWYPVYPPQMPSAPHGHSQQYGSYGDASYGGYPPPPTVPPADLGRNRLARFFSSRRAATGVVLAVAVLAGAGAGAGVTAEVMSDGHHTVGTAASGTGTGNTGSGSSGSGGSYPRGIFPGPPDGDPRGGYPGTSSSVSASAAQSVGVVDIDTVDGYQGAEAAGTGLVLTATGEILTNNHVIDGATKINVTVVSTGKTYTAKVVGDSPTKDIAVLQLAGASGLATAHLATTASLTVGENVTGVGNAGGTGGTPKAARGKIVALGKTIKASSEDGSGAEKLRNVIVTNAAIVAGDSGGPLYDSANQVIGIDTAASSSPGVSRAFAIPISRAVRIANEIQAGDASSTINLGYPAFIGVALAPSSGRPVIEHVYSGSPAAKAGLRAGDTITAVDGTTVRSYRRLHRLIAAKSPGDTASVTYTDTSGASRTVRVPLTAGPAA